MDGSDRDVWDTTRHLDASGRPLCDRPPLGAFIVEQPVDVTCAACLLVLSCRLAARRGGRRR